MNSHPEVSCYFIQSRPKIDQAYIDGDTVWCPVKEGMGKPIFDKTLAALELFDGYQYLFRTNLSSFIVLDRLVKFLDLQRDQKFYSGYLGWHGNINFASGCGFTLSWDLVQLLLEKKSEWESRCSEVLNWDDVIFAKALLDYGITPEFAQRCDILSVADFSRLAKPSHHYHFRVKTSETSFDDRLRDDLYIHQQLHRTYPQPDL